MPKTTSPFYLIVRKYLVSQDKYEDTTKDGICEALKTQAFLHPDGKFKGIFTGRYNVVEGSGVVALGRDLVSLDAILLNLSDTSRRGIEEETLRIPLDQAEEEFGAIDRKAIEDARMKVKSWIS